MKILGIIPARYNSSRFPGKVMAEIEGKTMIQRVYEQAKKTDSLEHVLVATDNEKVFKHVESFGGDVIMTDVTHLNGTARCTEAFYLSEGNYDFLINIQGDEPFIQPQQIEELASVLNDDVEIATLAKKIETEDNLFNENVVKVVMNHNQEALYFSRSTIPFVREMDESDWLEHHDFYKHIGLYGYRHDVLKKLCQLAPTPLELAENLEQLRWLESGFKIKVGVTHYDSHAVDTPGDLEFVKNLFLGQE